MTVEELIDGLRKMCKHIDYILATVELSLDSRAKYRATRMCAEDLADKLEKL